MKLPTAEELARKCAVALDGFILKEGKRYTQRELYDIIQEAIPLAELLAVAEEAEEWNREDCTRNLCGNVAALHSKLSTHKDSAHES